jgi:hypothetical protein
LPDYVCYGTGFYSGVKCVYAVLAFVSPHSPMPCRTAQQSCSSVVVLVPFCGSTNRMAQGAFAVSPSSSISECPFVRQLLHLLVKIYVRIKLGESKGGVGHCWVLAADLGFNGRPLGARPIPLLPYSQLHPGHNVLVPGCVFLAGVISPLHSKPTVVPFCNRGLRAGLEIEAQAVETNASRHGTPNLASLGKIGRIAGHHYVRVKRVSALPTIAVGIVQAKFFWFAHY